MKIADLSAKQQTLHQSIQNISSTTDAINQMETNSDLPSTSPGSALDIVDELADRDCRKYNIVVYNFTEVNDRKADIESFKTLSNSVFKLDIGILKAVRLGPKISNKQRPLLLTLEDIDDKIYLLAHSHFLRKNEQYNEIYIAPDRTKLERVKHKKAVDELKQRRAKGESGLVIRNGIVTSRNNLKQGSVVQNTTQSS